MHKHHIWLTYKVPVRNNGDFLGERIKNFYEKSKENHSMSERLNNVKLHVITREMLHEPSVVSSIYEVGHFPPPQGEANHFLVTASVDNETVGVARLDFRPGAWLGHVVVGVKPELNGASDAVIEQMTSKLGREATGRGMTSLELTQRIVQETNGQEEVVERPLPRIGL